MANARHDPAMRVLDYLPKRRVPRPVWSARAVSLLAILVLVATGLPVLIFGERSLLVRAEMVAAIVAGVLWLTLAIGLYHGARVRRGEPMPTYAGLGTSGDSSGGGDWVPSGFDGVDDLFGALVGIVLWVVIAVLLVVALPLILEGVAFVAFVVFAAVVWVVHRALRQVFARAPRCRGRLGPTLRYASIFTLLYAGWLFGVLSVAHAMAR